MRSVVVAANAGFVLLAACGETTNSFYGTVSSDSECDRLRAEMLSANRNIEEFIRECLDSRG